ncbi:MAG: TonB-dependent receptor [Opitutaceae bacterium]|jgi:TonB-dependent receptor|nr:TonB-dependent receptor [Opitutaceae bacterium]
MKRMSPRHPVLLILALALAAAPAAPVTTAAAVEKPELRVAIKNVTAWPNLQKLADGTVVATIFNKPSHGQVEGDVECWASADGGVTWSLAGTATRHDPGTNRMNVAAGLARNGDLIVICGGWSDIPKPGVKKAIDRFRDFVLPPWVSRSADGGRTWTIDKTVLAGESGVPFGDIKIADNGDLLAIIYKGGTPWVWRSADDGRTWGDPVAISTGAECNETALLRLDGPNWLAASRSPLKGSEGLRLYKSDDDGRTWKFHTFAATGPCWPAHLLRLDDGRVLLTYGNRIPNDEGVDTVLSSDAGDTWSDPYRIARFDTWDGGYPASIQRADGRVLTVFYAKSSRLHDGYHMASAIWRPEPGKGILAAPTPALAQSDPSATPATSPAPAPLVQRETVARGIAGMVMNADTNTNLPNADISIPELNLNIATDERGRFELPHVPPGTYVLTASYLGLESERTVISVPLDSGAWVFIEMHSNVYQMEGLVVTGEREGNAAAITRQRNALHVTTNLALDTFGALPNDNIGEVLARMPGIAAGVNDDGVLQISNIRGTTTALNSITVDGDTMQGGGIGERHADITVLPASLFEEIEIIKAPTPEMRADSLGGNVNIKTVSLLTQRRRRLTNFSLGMRWAPDFFDPIPIRRAHPIHPQFSFTHRQLFDVGKGTRNLALLIGGVYSENVAASYMRTARYRSNYTAHEMEAAGKPVPDEVGVYSYSLRDYYALYQKRSINFKVEFAPSTHTSFHLSGIYVDLNYPSRNYTTVTLTTPDVANYDPIANVVIPNGHIMRGTTDLRTIVEMGASNHNNIGITSNLTSNFDRERKIEGGGKITIGNLDIDFNLSHSQRHYSSDPGEKYGPGGGGTVSYNSYNVGWILDQTASAAHPKLTQNGGNDWFNIDYYSNLRVTQPGYDDQTDFSNARANVRYRFPFSFPLSIKGGVWMNREERERVNYHSKVYYYQNVGSPRLFLNPDVRPTASIDAGGDFPFLNPVLVGNDILAHPERWSEDAYVRTQRYFQSSAYGLTEDSVAGFLQAQFQIKGFRMLGGARYERTTDDVFGHLPSAHMSTAEERAEDPVGAATRDFGNYKELKGSYGNWFPSLHFVQKITTNFQARFSWSNTIGRPPPSYLYPRETISEPTSVSVGRITLNDPGIKPQFARNLDFAVEYYSKRVGQFTAGVFRKKIDDFIYTTMAGWVGEGVDNGWNGDYAGYEIYRATNGGKATVDGLEINYSQSLTFLPGFLRGLSVYANGTWLRTEGDYDADGNMDDMTLVGFVPRTINGGIKLNYRGLMVSVDGRSQGSYYYTVADIPAARIFTYTRNAYDLNITYQFSPLCTVFVLFSNFTNVPVRRYQYSEGRPYEIGEPGPTITFGIRGWW